MMLPILLASSILPIMPPQSVDRQETPPQLRTVVVAQAATLPYALTNSVTGTPPPVRQVDIRPAASGVPVAIVLSIANIAPVQTMLSFVFSPSPSPNVAGYALLNGPADNFYTESNYVGMQFTNTVPTALTGRIFTGAVAIDLTGDCSDPDQIYWPPFTNIVLVSGETNVSTDLNGPRITFTNDLFFTNPPTGTMFFFGNPVTITHLIQ